MSARIQGTKIALSKKKQADIATAALVADMWCFTKLNSSLAGENLAIEDDAAEYGKGHEFATQLFTAGWDVAIPMEKYGSSQFLAWVWNFVLGNVVKTGSASPWTYTATPIVAGSGLELPYFTYVEQVPGTDDDRMAVGCAIEEVQMFLGSGPGRQNCRLQVTAVGSGLITTPSGIVVPAPQIENLLPAGIAAVTINGVDYVANKNLISVQMGWKNNIQVNDGFYPGSGFQTPGDPTTGQIRGRLEIGTRTPTFTFVVRAAAGSTESALLAALTSGAATVSLPVSATHSFLATWQKLAFKVVQRTDANGLATTTVTGGPMYDNTNGILTVVTKTNVDAICG